MILHREQRITICMGTACQVKGAGKLPDDEEDDSFLNGGHFHLHARRDE